MGKSNKPDLEVLEEINMLVAMICIAAAVGCTAITSNYIFYDQLNYIKISNFISLLARGVMLVFTAVLLWKYQQIKHLPFSVLIAGRKMPMQDDGFMEVVITRATTNSWLLTTISLMLFLFMVNRSTLPTAFYLFALLTVTTASYGISYIYMYLKEARLSAQEQQHE